MLILNRNRKEHEPAMEPKVFETDDLAYNCGRLLAVLDDLQQAAHEYKLEGAGVVERYYGTASSVPNSAFPILWRLHRHHLKKLERLGKGGTAHAIERHLAEIACRFTPATAGAAPSFPRTFGLMEQGRFALGFYQERAAAFERMAAAREAKTHTDNTQEAQQ
jgi:CRISPR-associated protein Csd1